MPSAKTRYTSVLWAKKFLIFKMRCLSISEKMTTVVEIQLSSIIFSLKSLYFLEVVCFYNLIQDFTVSVWCRLFYVCILLGLLAVYAFDYLHAIKYKQ